jgi:hypothetical protein
MIRFAWLQSRTQALVAIAGLAAVAVVLLITGPDLTSLYATIIRPCAERGDCSQTTIASFLQNHREIRIALDILVIVVPGIIGVFWGAPLVARELEAGTFRLAWTQSVTRTRWLAVKLGVMGLASIAVAGLVSLMTTWWNNPLDRVEANAYSTFDARDIVPLGYAAFGFVLGVAAGVFIRRTLPAMATVAVVFTAVRVTMSHWIRPLLFAPARLALALDPRSTGFGRTSSGPDTLQPGSPRIPNAWIQSIRIVDDGGKTLTPDVLASTCPQLGGADRPSGGPSVRAQVPDTVKNALEDCITKVGNTYHQVVTYHPADRYWAFQWYELAIYVGAAFALAGICIWSLRRRS